MRSLELNQVIEAIRKRGLNPIIFDFPQDTNDRTVVLKQEAKLWFTFRQSDTEFNQFLVSYSRYKPDWRVVKFESKFALMVDALTHFDKWLKTSVTEYLEVQAMPDPLEQLRNNPNFEFQNGEKFSNDQFSTAERETVLRSIDEFKKLLTASFELTQENCEYIESELSYLKESVGKQNKRDFLAIFRGVLYDISINLASNFVVEGGKALFQMKFSQIVQQAFLGFVRLVTE